MARSWIPLALSIAAFASPAGAQPGASCPSVPRVTSYSEVYAGGSLDSGTQIGDPATSSVMNGYADPGGGYDFEADSGLTIGTQFFVSASHLGGHTTIAPSGATGFSVGEVTDCLTFGGYQGGAQAHIPIELSGSASVSWSSSAGYVPTSIFDPAYARLAITCAAYSYGTSTQGNCNHWDFIFDTYQTIDTTAELVFAFRFGDPVTIQFAPRVTAGFSNGGGGGLMGAFVTLQVQGLLLPIYVTDFGENPLPNVSISATSGVDYFHPVPEPQAASVALAAIGALVMLRRARCRASR